MEHQPLILKRNLFARLPNNLSSDRSNIIIDFTTIHKELHQQGHVSAELITQDTHCNLSYVPPVKKFVSNGAEYWEYDFPDEKYEYGMETIFYLHEYRKKECVRAFTDKGLNSLENKNLTSNHFFINTRNFPGMQEYIFKNYVNVLSFTIPEGSNVLSITNIEVQKQTKKSLTVSFKKEFEIAYSSLVRLEPLPSQYQELETFFLWLFDLKAEYSK